jgi:TM2 domain-containing membrane protein YozV
MNRDQLYKCSACGHIVAATASRCMGCGTSGPKARHPNSWRTAEAPEAIAEMLAAEGTSAASSPRSLVPQVVAAAAPQVVTGGRQVVVIAREKSTGVAVLLSFFWCGLGQIYNGQVGKGIVMMGSFPPLIWIGVLMVFFGGLAAGASSENAAGGMVVFGLVTIFLAVSLWIYGMVNAHKEAGRINQRNLQYLRG